MDNGLIIPYCDMTEMWGHGRIAGAGNGETGPSAKPSPEGKSAGRWRSVTGSEEKSSEDRESMPSRKAAIAHGAPVP